MSKSYGNTIDVFLPEKELKKQIMSIITDSTPLEEPKNPDTCIVFKLYALLADTHQTQDLRAKYLAGNFGYGHAKQALLGLILDHFRKERETFDLIQKDSGIVEDALQRGAKKAKIIAQETLEGVRALTGYKFN